MNGITPQAHGFGISNLSVKLQVKMHHCKLIEFDLRIIWKQKPHSEQCSSTGQRLTDTLCSELLVIITAQKT